MKVTFTKNAMPNRGRVFVSKYYKVYLFSTSIEWNLIRKKYKRTKLDIGLGIIGNWNY